MGQQHNFDLMSNSDVKKVALNFRSANERCEGGLILSFHLIGYAGSDNNKCDLTYVDHKCCS